MQFTSIIKYLLFVLFLVLNSPIFAQNDTVQIKDGGLYVRDSDGTVVKIGRGGIQVYDQWDSVDIQIGNPDPNRNVRTRWILMDLGTDVLLADDNYTLDNGIDPFEISAWKSTNVNLHLFQQRVNLSNQSLFFKWGLTFEFHKYYFNNPVVMLADQAQVTFDYQGDTKFKKNRLMASYLTMPIMFSLKTKPKKARGHSFHIDLGAFGGPRLGSNFKTKVDGNKDKVRDDFNLSKWRYGLRGEIGYSHIKMYATLGLNELFQESKNNGYKVTPLSVGFIIIPF